MTRRMSNIPLRDFRLFLFNNGLSRTGYNGGHEKWEREGLLRPIMLQTHVDPVPQFVIKNALNALGISKSDFLEQIK